MEDIKISVKMKLSALWVSMMLLYIYADILSLFRPGELGHIMQGFMGPLQANEASLLFASVLMIIPAIMVVLSLILKPAVNRWTNVSVGVLYTLINIGNLVGESWIYYFLFGLFEIATTLLIVRYAWKWPNPELGAR